ncbi:MAG TPA: HEAT repeat domain-containing protein [Phototrophicaceae bacterium]|nr:HEAT repeat domain-containing protein [Phototrophicaceae bacterium]
MFDQYLTDLTHTDPTVRYEAAQALGASNDARAIQPLIGALRDDNAKVQYAVFSGLIKLNAGEAAAPILDMLRSDINSRVWQLLKLNIGLRLRTGLLEMMPHGSDAMSAQIAAALQTPGLDEAQRALFIRMLGRTANLDQVDLLISLMVRGTPTIQGAAAEALGYVGDARAVAPLLLSVKDSRNELREIAAEALGRIGDASAFDPLIELLRDDNEWVRRAAAVALGELGDRRAVEPLSAAMQDEQVMVQDAAFEALKKLSYGKYDMTL